MAMRGTSWASVLPLADVRGALRELFGRDVGITPDAISDAANAIGAATPWVMVPNRGEHLDPYATLDAKSVLDLVLSAGPPLEGELIVLTDDWLPDGRVIPAARLREVFESRESWIGADLIIIERQRRRVILVHHEGAYVHIQL
jgi:hypothetical protein